MGIKKHGADGYPEILASFFLFVFPFIFELGPGFPPMNKHYASWAWD